MQQQQGRTLEAQARRARVQAEEASTKYHKMIEMLQRRHERHMEALQRSKGAEDRADCYAGLGHIHFHWAKVELEEARRHCSAPPNPICTAAARQKRQELISACRYHVEQSVAFYISGKIAVSRDGKLRDWLGGYAQSNAAVVLDWAEKQSGILQGEKELTEDSSVDDLSLISTGTLSAYLRNYCNIQPSSPNKCRLLNGLRQLSSVVSKLLHNCVHPT